MCELCAGLNISHSHVHSDASRIDGLGPVGRLVKAAKSKGAHHMALTDHGTLANSISFVSAANAIGIHPVVGMECYVAMDGEVFHLTLLGDGNRGFKSLVELNNAGQRGDYSRPAFHIDLLKKYSDGITCLTGCPASPLQALDYSEARTIGLKLKSIYGERLFAEFMFVSHSSPWVRAYQLATDLKIHPVVTNDVHFPFQEDAKSHEILVRLKAAFSYDSRLLYLASAHDIMTRVESMAPEFINIAQMGIRNSYRLLSKLQSPSWSGIPTLPSVENAETAIRQQSVRSLVRFLEANPDEDPEVYMDRMDFELSVIAEMGFMTYFYILNDIITYSRGVGVRIGPGRGSGAGSLILFLLNITEINPIQYGLAFERFLNPKRKEMPDVDIDLDSDHRELTIRYAQERWGGMPVATYSRYTEKVLIADLCRFFRVPRDVSGTASDEGIEGPAFARVTKMFPPVVPTYNAMLGQIRHIGQHPGGIIITDVPVPVERTSHGGLVAAWTEGEHKELTAAGVVKYDLLGVSALSVLSRLETKHGRRAPEPTDDAPEYALFRKGDLTGIFQFAGSDGIIGFTKKVKPNKFEDLVAINALYRPGPLDSGAVDNYTKWRKKPRKLHPLIDDILAETYGIICYQEQFMAIFARITSGDLADADLARKVVVKSDIGNPEWEAKVAKLKAKFYVGAKDLGMDKDIVVTIWKEIMTHSRYSFNKSHSVAYAHIAWQMAWWKFHYAADFYAAMLSVDPVQAQKYIFDIVGRGIEIVPPHINKSTLDYESDGEKIYLPLKAIKFLGDNGVDELMAKRPFVSVAQFMRSVKKRSVPGRARLGLWQMGAFDGIPGRMEELDIKTPPSMTKAEKQSAYLGFMLPSPAVMKAIRVAENQGLLAGIVSQVEDRESKYGAYKVYRLIPSGTFWSRNLLSIQEGDMIQVKVKKDSGKALMVNPLL